MPFTPPDRLSALPPYLFVEIDRRKRAAIAAGKDVISFGVGDPDLPTHAFIVERMKRAIDEPANHRYPHDLGYPGFRAELVKFFARRYGVELDAEKEILTLIGSKEGLGHLALAVLNPGDVALVPDPGYPVYRSGTLFAGGVPHTMPLCAARDWLPDLGAVPREVAARAKLMYLNYPNNPTGAIGSRRFLEEAVEFCRTHDILLCHDAAYNEMYFDQPCPSVLEIPGARDVAVELHSLSKTFNMTGWRLGFAVGNPHVLSALARIKSNLDSGQFSAIQEAGAAAYAGIDHPQVLAARETYRQRATALASGLGELGFGVQPPRATFYVWARTPRDHSAMDTTARLLEQAAVVCIPGVGFGQHGEGYVRFAVTVTVERIAEALKRMKAISW